MKITFDLPHVFSPGSSPDEVRIVRAELRRCLTELKGSSAGNRGVPSLTKGPGKTQVTFGLPSVFHANSSPLDNARSLQCLLRCLTRVNVIYLQLRPGRVPPLYGSGVVYDRTQVWDSIPALYARRYGDCKSLTCALVAEYAVQGVQTRPVFRWISLKNGQTNYHILVHTPFAVQFEDPSKVLGMGLHENAYFKKTG